MYCVKKILQVDQRRFLYFDLTSHNENIKVISAGGINIDNIEKYVKTATDSIVTTALYFVKRAN